MGPLACEAGSPCLFPPRSERVFGVWLGLAVGGCVLIGGARGITLRFRSRSAVLQRLGHVVGVVQVTAELWFRRHIVGVWGHDISFSRADKCGSQATTPRTHTLPTTLQAARLVRSRSTDPAPSFTANTAKVNWSFERWQSPPQDPRFRGL